MRSRKPLAWALAYLVLVGALVPVGRWERSHRAHDQVRGLRRVLAAVGPLDQPSLDAFRHLERFDCLLYRRRANPFALELCVDHAGRLVEAIDRRHGRAKIWSLRDDPSRSTVRVDQAEVERLLRKMETTR